MKSKFVELSFECKKNFQAELTYHKNMHDLMFLNYLSNNITLKSIIITHTINNENDNFIYLRGDACTHIMYFVIM